MAELPLLAEWQRVTHRLLRTLDTSLGDLDVSPSEVNALACFAGGDSLSVRQLLDATGQRASTLTGVLDRLERRGLAARRPHPEDRRSVQIVLTSEGRRASETVGAAFAEVERRLPSRQRVRDILAAMDHVVDP